MNLKAFADELVEMVAYSNGVSKYYLNFDKVLNEWAESKKRFLDMWGGRTKVISESEFTVSVSVGEFAARLDDFLATSRFQGLIPENIYSDFEFFLRTNICGFHDNTVVSPYENRNIRIGQKLTKSFKNFKGVEVKRLQENFSRMVLFSTEVKGNLVCSVDPIDFATLSPVDGHYDSCVKLTGDYRTSSLAYMVDPTTVIFYIDLGEEDEGLPHHTQKAWRMLGYVSPDNNEIIFSSQYGALSSNEIFEDENFQKFVDSAIPPSRPDAAYIITDITRVPQSNIRYLNGRRPFAHEGLFLPSANDSLTITPMSRLFTKVREYQHNDVSHAYSKLPNRGRSVFARVCPREERQPLQVGTDSLPCSCEGCSNNIFYTTTFFCLQHAYELDDVACCDLSLSRCACCGEVICCDGDVATFYPKECAEGFYVEEGLAAVCEKCYEDFYAECDCCRRTVHIDEIEDGLCECCRTEREEE